MAVNEISNTYVATFAANVIHLAQQRKSRLRDTVMVESSPKAMFSFNLVSARAGMTANTTYGTNAGKRPATAYADTVYNNRIVVPVPYTAADSYNQEDAVRMLVDPQSVLTQAFAAQLARTYDDVIIASWFAAALDQASNSTAHPAGSQLGGATTAPSFALVNLAREQLDETDLDPDEQKFFVVTPNFVSALLTDPKATSFDYANAKALMGGAVVDGWMGFSWRVSNRLVSPGGTPKQIYGAAYAKSAMALGINNEGSVDVGKDPTHQFATTIQIRCDLGAVRLSETQVLRIHYLESN